MRKSFLAVQKSFEILHNLRYFTEEEKLIIQ